ncbi:MAG: sulfur carrier protein ThiS [Chloroflexota bacterium]
MITLIMNGRERTLPTEMSIASYLADKKIDPRMIAVEHNGTILAREQFATVTLREGDNVEIVRMIGGG